MTEWLQITDTTNGVAEDVLIPIDRIKSIGSGKQGGTYVLTVDGEEFFTDMTVAQFARMLDAVQWIDYPEDNYPDAADGTLTEVDG